MVVYLHYSFLSCVLRYDRQEKKKDRKYKIGAMNA